MPNNHLMKHTDEPIPVELLRESLPDFIKELDASGTTRDVYRKAVSLFVSWSERMPLTAATMRLYRDFLVNRKLIPNTISTYLSATNQFLSCLVEKGALASNPAENLRRPKIPKHHLRDGLTKKEARKLLASIPKNSLKGHRDYAMVNVMLRTGVREIEIARATISDIVVKEGKRVLLVHGKGKDGKDAFVILTPKAYLPLQAYLKKIKPAGPSELLFAPMSCHMRSLTTRAIRKIVSSHLTAARLKSKRITPHSLRHTAITLAIQGGKGKNILKVQQMARHADISTTLKYFHEYARMKNAAEFDIDI